MAGQLTYRRLRAPQDDGDALIEPSLDQIPQLLEANLALRRMRRLEFLGRPVAELAEGARGALINAAARYTSAYRDVERSTHRDGPLLLSGHQPELFHPGVWFKNFVLASLAQRSGGTAINLIIDNDVPHAAAIRVPTGSLEEPRLETVLFDRALPDVPFEQRPVLDAACFESFAERVQRTIAPFVRRPLVETLWPAAMEALKHSGNLGRSLAEARHRLEGGWGVDTLEVPLSDVCRFEAWHWFTAHLLLNLPRLQACYNGALVEYRRIAGIRSRTHPVPELAREDNWREAPLWIWSDDRPQRRRLFVRTVGDALELTDRAGFRRSIAADESRIVEQLAALAGDGVKLRPRALSNTMFARLVLGDLFLHGIGGSKYDELTDEIIRRFFDVEPPAYCTVTATRRLLPVNPVARAVELRDIDRELRDLRFNPDRHLDGVSTANRSDEETVRTLIAEKQRWIAQEPPLGQRFERHRRLTEINERLAAYVEPQRRELLARRPRVSGELRAARMLGSREFSFCLFPEPSLRAWLLELSHGTS